MLQWEEPIDLRDDRVRRLFAEELVTQLRRVGAATVAEMCAADVALLRIPAEEEELDQVSEAARRMGWAELRDRPTETNQKEWAVSDLGLAVKRPPSLGLGQVVSRVIRFADPVRAGATAWLPIVAIVAGGIAAQQAQAVGSEATLDAIRIASISVLSVALGWGAVGEVYLVKAMRAFKRVGRTPFYVDACRFHSLARLVSVAVIDVLLLVVFGMVLFWVWPWLLLPVPPLAAVVAVNLLIWRFPAGSIWGRRPPR